MRLTLAAVTLALIAALLVTPNPGRRLQLPAGITEVRSEIFIPAGTEVVGAPSGSVLHMAAGFRGRAALIVRGNDVHLRDFAIDGNRAALETRAGLPPSDVAFANFTRSNGVLAAGVSHVSVENVNFRKIAGFAILVNHSHDITIERVRVADSGSRNAAGRNNTTGGILLEQGTSDFRVLLSVFEDIRGNAVWTHSLYGGPRNVRGLIALNSFQRIGRDAIQVGHAIHVRVDQNEGGDIGYPAENIDIENLAIPVAIDTAGDVGQCSYIENRFSRVAGKCIDLDGFHDGLVRGNFCRDLANYGIVMNNSNPDMESRGITIVGNGIESARFGGIFVIGTGHRITRNILRNLNTAHCNASPECYYAPGQPDMLRSGIYLGRGGERPDPARGNLIEGNQISGYDMRARCIGLAPGISPSANLVQNNVCRDE